MSQAEMVTRRRKWTPEERPALLAEARRRPPVGNHELAPACPRRPPPFTPR